MDAPIEPLPTDFLLVIRDGHTMIGVPHPKDRAMFVPEDYLVLLGFAYLFGDPNFRNMLIACVNANIEQFDGILGLRSGTIDNGPLN